MTLHFFWYTCIYRHFVVPLGRTAGYTCNNYYWNLILQKPLIFSWKSISSFSQDSYWAAFWWNLYFLHCSLSLVFLRICKVSLDLKNYIFCQHWHKQPFKGRGGIAMFSSFCSLIFKNNISCKWCLKYHLYYRIFLNKILSFSVKKYCNPNYFVLGKKLLNRKLVVSISIML